MPQKQIKIRRALSLALSFAFLASSALPGSALAQINVQAPPSAQPGQNAAVSFSASGKASLLSASSRETSGAQSIVLEFAGPQPQARAFSLSNPRRLVVDFPDSVNQTGQNQPGFALAGTNAKRSEIASDDRRLRAVFVLNEDSEWNTAWNGSSYVITLFKKGSAPASGAVFAETQASQAGSAAAQTAQAPGARASQPASQGASPLTQDIVKADFKKGATPGSGRLTIDLSNPQTPIDIKAFKGGVTIDFLKSSIPSYLQKKFNVADLMTPASSVEMRQMEDRARITLHAQGQWEHSAYQLENRFVLELKPVFNQAVTSDPSQQEYKGDKVTLNFQNIDVRTILQVLSDFSGMNVVVSDAISGGITLRLKDVPWDQALDIILRARNLDKRAQGNVIWIDTRANLIARERDENQFRRDQEQNKPVISETFQINYQRADAVRALLTTSSGAANGTILTRNGSIVVDARTNQLFIQDIPERIEAIRTFIRRIDIPVRQVLIEARIVEANDSWAKNVGSRLGYNDARTTPTGSPMPLGIGNNTRYYLGGNLNTTGVTTRQNTSGTASFTDQLLVNMPAIGASGFNPSAFSFILFNSAMTRFLNLELSAIVAEGQGQVLSNPRVVTADQQEATIEQGTDIPYQAATSSGATSVSFKKATLSLRVRPQITPDGNVIMNLSVSKDSIGQNTAAGPAIDTKNVNTQVLVENGGTVAIGGIYSQQDTELEGKTPFFGDLPYIGTLFRSRQSNRTRSELLILVSPKIVLPNTGSPEELDAADRADPINPVLIKPERANKEWTPKQEVQQKPGLPYPLTGGRALN